MSFELYEYKIEDLGKVITGKTPPSKISDAFSAQGIPFVTPKDMDGRRLIDKTERYLSSQGVEAVRNCLLPQNSIAVSCIGSDMGKTVLLPGESITNQQINAIVVDSEHFDYKYVYYYLSTLQDDFKAIAGGSATPILNKGHFSQFKVSLPVKPVQNKIALILDSLDTKIEVNTEINHTLEQMAQALFKSWFVDFEPVKAKMAVLESGGSQADAMLAAMTAISGKNADALAVFEREHPEQYAELKATAELFPSAMQESEGRDIPKGWAVVKTEELTSKIGMGPFGSNIKVSTFVDEGIPIISGQHLKESILNDGENNFVTLEHADKLKSSNVFSEDIIFTHAGSIGQVSIIPEFSEYDRYVISQRQFFLRADKKLISPYYLLYFFRSRTGQHLLLSNASQVGVPSIARPSSHLKNIELVAPDFKLVKKFEDHCKTIINGVVQRKKQTVLLKNIRDTLLPKLLSGEITLPEAEQAVSEAENV
ncbi:TPA: restriction endonuclease subunit S [Enterobacter roggenkampii]|uniref:restriction endonuclease subunit S n=1 Tax=Enterobacter cloacae TaxID=550 RepID=UPI00202202BA|nr:restriction endonuclease subunit S [Enterobacter cloacae]MCL8178433.1 restriction endonuclease subunit S [Enterobacter cloacae]MCM7409687.1 restriction endonuclease subunit S [Enterobacter cloacae]HCM9149052.1 restriction endonuclease subunit S [Enterobacter roggenkampii]HDT6544937.1 restriction endonuclease subunit S [Kluyvera ascorbata]